MCSNLMESQNTLGLNIITTFTFDVKSHATHRRCFECVCVVERHRQNWLGVTLQNKWRILKLLSIHTQKSPKLMSHFQSLVNKYNFEFSPKNFSLVTISVPWYTEFLQILRLLFATTSLFGCWKTLESAKHTRNNRYILEGIWHSALFQFSFVPCNLACVLNSCILINWFVRSCRLCNRRQSFAEKQCFSKTLFILETWMERI